MTFFPLRTFALDGKKSVKRQDLKTSTFTTSDTVSAHGLGDWATLNC